MQVHLLRLERLCLETGREDWREINRLSFARSLIRKIVKHEVDGKIDFTNLFRKKLKTRDSLLTVDQNFSLGYKVTLEIGGRGKTIS